MGFRAFAIKVDEVLPRDSLKKREQLFLPPNNVLQTCRQGAVAQDLLPRLPCELSGRSRWRFPFPHPLQHTGTGTGNSIK